MFLRSLKYAFLIVVLTAPVVMAQEKLKIFPLKNRMVEEVIPIIRPLLGRNESVTGMRQQLIVRASPRKLREIKNLLEKIDGQLKNLRITVKQGLRSQLNEMEAGIDAQIPIGDSGRVVINPRKKEGGIIVEGKPGGGTIRGRISERESFSDDEYAVRHHSGGKPGNHLYRSAGTFHKNGKVRDWIQNHSI